MGRMLDRVPIGQRAALVVTLATVLAGCSSAPQAVMPDGRARIPVNSEERINAYKERLEEQNVHEAERVRWAREINDMREQLSQVKAATIILAAEAEGKTNSPIAKAAAARFGIQSPSLAFQQASPGAAAPSATTRQEAARGEDPVRIQVTLPDAQAVTSLPAVPPAPTAQRPTAALQTGIEATTNRPAAPPAPALRTDTVVPTSPERAPEAGRPPEPIPQSTSFSSVALMTLPRPSPLKRQLADSPAGHPPANEEPVRFTFPQERGFVGFAPSAELGQRLVASARRGERIIIRSRWTGSQDERLVQREAEARAEKVRQFLLNYGVDPDRIWINTGRASNPESCRIPALQVEVSGTLRNAAPQRSDSGPALARVPSNMERQ
jgi:hypothetical protein